MKSEPIHVIGLFLIDRHVFCSNIYSGMKKHVQTAGCHGMTLIEVIVTAAITSIVLAGVVTSVLMGNQINHANAQHVTAFGLCKEWYEQMRSVPYTNLAASCFRRSPFGSRIWAARREFRFLGFGPAASRDQQSRPEAGTHSSAMDLSRQGSDGRELDGMIYRRR
jgi:prepilin-type N-terminal cleavage/methylation domain-containing protein